MDSHFDFNIVRTVVGFILSAVVVYTTLRFNHIKDIVDINKENSDLAIERLNGELKGVKATIEKCQDHCEDKRSEVNDKINELKIDMCKCERDEA